MHCLYKFVEITQNSSHHLIVHSISLLMASTYTLAMSSSLLLSSPLPHQLPPIFLHNRTQICFGVSQTLVFLSIATEECMLAFIQEMCTSASLARYESNKWSVFCYLVLSPFV